MSKTFTIPFTLCVAVATYLTVEVIELLTYTQIHDMRNFMVEHNTRDLRLFRFVNLSWVALVFYCTLLIRNRKLPLRTLWYSWVYFAMYTGINYVLLREQYFEIISNTEFWDGGFNMSPFTGVFWIALAALFTFLLQVVLRRNIKVSG